MNKTVLIIDDNRDATEILSLAVEHWGYAARPAYDGKEGLSLALSVPHPNLIISDYHMPTMNGGELRTRLVEAGFGHIPFVLMTATTESIPSKLLMDRILKKPILLDELQQVIRDYLAD